MRNSSALDENISRWTAEHSAEDAMNILQDAGIAAGVVQNGIDICARDPQLKERGFWPTVSTAKGATTQVTGIPFKLSGTSGQVRTAAPEVGENTDYVLGELLGLTRAAQESLIAEGAVWP
jgi:crotonobetainyl-CoA:carnitine CoA-transferase CaiB-like acyl-CoA transferase